MVNCVLLCVYVNVMWLFVVLVLMVVVSRVYSVCVMCLWLIVSDGLLFGSVVLSVIWCVLVSVICMSVIVLLSSVCSVNGCGVSVSVCVFVCGVLSMLLISVICWLMLVWMFVSVCCRFGLVLVSWCLSM